MFPAGILSPLRRLLLEQAGHVRGFMGLLMKSRNGLDWTLEDKTTLRLHLRELAQSLPFIGLLSLPGGSLLLPLLAWFLDRRKRSRLLRSP